MIGGGEFPLKAVEYLCFLEETKHRRAAPAHQCEAGATLKERFLDGPNGRVCSENNLLKVISEPGLHLYTGEAGLHDQIFQVLSLPSPCRIDMGVRPPGGNVNGVCDDGDRVGEGSQHWLENFAPARGIRCSSPDKKGDIRSQGRGHRFQFVRGNLQRPEVDQSPENGGCVGTPTPKAGSDGNSLPEGDLHPGGDAGHVLDQLCSLHTQVASVRWKVGSVRAEMDGFVVMHEIDFIEEIDLMKNRFDGMVVIPALADHMQTDIDLRVCSQCHGMESIGHRSKYVNNEGDATNPSEPGFLIVVPFFCKLGSTVNSIIRVQRC